MLDHCIDQQFVKQNLIRNNTSEILKIVLENHLKTCLDCCPTKPCHLLNETLKTILRQSWNLSGKFTFLNIFIRTFSADIVRVLEPHIENILLQTAQEYSLSTYACDTFISLLSKSNDNSIAIGLVVDLFHINIDKTIFNDIESIKTAICEYLIPKLTQENCEIISQIINRSIECRFQSMGVNKLILFCTHQLLYVNNQKKISFDERENVLNMIFNEEFAGQASVDCDESVRMQFFSILCKEVVRQRKQDPVIWKLINQFLMHNLSTSSNKLRQHFITGFKPILSIVIVPNISDEFASSTMFLTSFLAFLLSNFYPGASFYKRSTILAYLELVFTAVADNRIFDILTISDDDYTILLKTLIYSFTDTFEDNRMNACKCFVILVNNRPQHHQYDRMKNIALIKSNDSNPHDCSVAYTIMKTLLEIKEYILTPQDLCEELICQLENNSNNIKNNVDLIEMATKAPFYSSLFCLRQLLHDYFDEIAVKMLFERIISLCYKVNDIIYPFIASAAPEGCLPDDIRNSVDLTQIDCHPEYLTICCWRSCKEVSLILGYLSAKLVDKYPDLFLQINNIADFFFTQLTNVTHKGAFESLSVGFEKLCLSFWRSLKSDVSDIPLKFIKRSIDILNMNEDLCSTRRSAGLPHLFQVLITTEPLINKERSSLALVMQCLHSILSTADSNDSADRKRIIHVFNILRVLFKESSLLNQIVSYTFTSIKYSVQFFSSSMWPLRNSATLLYCSLIERMFGPSKTIKFHNKFNRLNSKIFFNRYSEMYNFINDYLTMCNSESLNLETSTKVYPILIILGRLVPESDDFQNQTFDLTYIKTSIVRYLRSPIWIVRVSAAKAVAALCQGEVSSLNTIDNLITEIIACTKEHNFIHGIIKTIRCIVEDLVDNLFISDNHWSQLQDMIARIWDKLSPIILNLSTGSQCPIEFMNLLEFLANKSPRFFTNLQISFQFPNIKFVWQIKLIIMFDNLRMESDNCLKGTLLESLQHENYLIRQELLTQFCNNSNLITKYFSNCDFVVLIDILMKECHPSVDYLWIKFLDLFISSIDHIPQSSISTLLNYLTNKLKPNQLTLRTKTFCSVIELLAVIFRCVDKINKEKDFSNFIDIIKENCVYEKDIEIRTSCSNSMRRIIENIRENEEKKEKIIEIIIIQLNDECIDIRNQAGKCFKKLLNSEPIENVLPSVIQTIMVKEYLKEQSEYVHYLMKNSPLGFNHKLIFVEKNSVFDSEEINFYYDFLEVHCGLILDRNGSQDFILKYSIEEIINKSNRFCRAYQMKLLDK